MAKRLYKVENDKKIWGICGGIAEYYNLDPTLVRIAWVLFTLVAFGLGIVLYVAFALIFPNKSEVDTTENKPEEKKEQ